MPNSTQQSVNPWKGLHFYTEEDQCVFYGREKEVLDLLRLLNRDCLTILFARSGMGKTSLIRAGLIPQLRKDNCLPVIVRIIPGDEAEFPPQQIIQALQLAAGENEVDIEALAESAGSVPETLWEYFHRHRFWGKRNDPIKPIVILDQFEELFTLGHGSPRTTAFLEELADLVENRMPSRLQQHLEVHEQKLSCDPRIHDYKILLSLREDFVPFLDRLQPSMPAVMRNRYCLEPLFWPSAVDIVESAGGPYVTSDVAEQIATAVTLARTSLDVNTTDVPIATSEVEPAYLSVMCHELFRRMVERNEQQINAQLVSEERGSILGNFYNRSFENLPIRVRSFVEDCLLSELGYRLTLPLVEADKAGVSRADLDQLVNQRLLRFEYRLGTTHVELSHDLLREIVVGSRTRRQQELEEGRLKQQAEEIKQKLRQSRVLAWAGATTTTVLLASIVIYLFGFKINSSIYSASFVKKWGIPYPIRRLPWGAESHRDATVKITRQGWWGAVKKLEMVNANGELTDQHNLNTYLAEPDVSIKPKSKFAYYEFAYDKEGKLVFEILRDRNGNIVTSLAYTTPPPSGQNANIVLDVLRQLGLYKKLDSKATAKAIFLGPDGFPLAQRQSRAEYIQFYYDNKGREIKHDFLDISGGRMLGPDNAYGRAFKFDSEGKLVMQTSLGLNGAPINDKVQNASQEIKYNSKGDLIEARALDARGAPTILISGWHLVRVAYDNYGRRTHVAFFSPSGKPVRDTKDFGAHLIKYSYDDRGNVVSMRYFDEYDHPTTPNGDDDLYPAHEVRFVYNLKSRPISIRLFEAGENKANSVDGWHEQRLSYGKLTNHLQSFSLFDKNGKPVVLAATGVHREDYLTDQFGQFVAIDYQDRFGRPINRLDLGYHRELLEYDSAGHITRRRYFNKSGVPVPDAHTGVHDSRVTFDRFGNELSESYFDVNNKKINNRFGYHKKQSTYNDFGLVKEELWFNQKGDPVKGPNGIYLVMYIYDNKGLLAQVRHLYRPVLKPMVDVHGVAEGRFAYNSKQQITKEQFYGPNGEPAEDSNGNHMILREYDAKGKETKTTKKRKDGRPNLYPALGIATRSRIFDIDGNWAEDIFTNSAGNFVVGPHGYARGVLTHDLGESKTMVNYGANGKIAFNKLYGFAKKVTNISTGFLIAEEVYYGTDGKLINGPAGYAEVKRLRLKDGEILQEMFYGARGIPSEGPQGFHRMIKTGPKSQPLYYDKQNNVLPYFKPNNPDSNLFAGLIYIQEILSMQNPASLSGLRAGDILWRYGGWSYPRSRKAFSALGRAPEIRSIANELIAEIRRRSPSVTEATILRDGKVKKISIPPLPEKSLGVKFDSRFVPIRHLSLWQLSLQ